MSKMKHLLRKLHIGDHNQQVRPPPPGVDPSPQTPSPLSPSSDLPQTASPSENESSNSNFNYFEEEFQMQLAMAISVSDPGQTPVDPETAQINAAKQISLGRSPSQSLAEFLSLRYSSGNVVNYDEKVIDGFYDVCGIDSNLLVQAKMPPLVDFEAVSVLDDIGYEVVLVNRAIDMELRKLEERVYFMFMECRTLNGGLNTSFLVQKIANLIVERMGGPVSDVEEMFRRWKARNRELRINLNTIILPLGSLDVGHSRQRALLFKVLADRVNLPCKLVKGSYYTGTDEGAVNLVKLDSGSEYIIDLMGAPGTLIPAEVSCGHNQNLGLDARSIGTVAGTASNQGALIRSLAPSVDESAKSGSLSSDLSATALELNINGRRIDGKIQTEQLEHDIRHLYVPSSGACEAPSAGKKPTARYEAGSRHAVSAANKPDFFPAMLSEECALAPNHLLPNIRSPDLRHDKLVERERLVSRERVVDQCHPEASLPKKKPSLVNNMSYDSSGKHLAEGLMAHRFKLDSAGYKSSSNAPCKQNLLVKDTNDDYAVGSELIDFSENTEAMELAGTDQSNTNMIQNMQNDPVLNGVAEILWEDLQIGERIGIGSYGEVYRAEWNGTEVAVKKFMKQDISGDALTQFKCEVEIMLRLRHPNVVLLMGAVLHPPNMSILTEFLPRGSLYRLLHRPNIQIDEKRRIKMAIDVAKGMNYLHTSHPIIVHRDLKTPNLLVDKNWVVKVGDFGMSRLQHHTFLSSKSAAGTAEWMAPEVLRNEPSNEKSDVYSFGVILWELATLRVPWTEMNSMQVVGAVGFQGRHLDIPSTVDPLVAEIISECWNRNPQARPSFAEIIARLKCLQRLSMQKRGVV